MMTDSTTYIDHIYDTMQGNALSTQESWDFSAQKQQYFDSNT